LLSELDAERKDQEFLERLHTLRLLPFDPRISDISNPVERSDNLRSEFLRLFSDEGLDLRTTSPAEVAAAVSQRSEKYRRGMLTALYSWRYFLLPVNRNPEADSSSSSTVYHHLSRRTGNADDLVLQDKLYDILAALDADTWRASMRAASQGSGDPDALSHVVSTIDIERQPPEVVLWLSAVIWENDYDHRYRALDLLKQSALYHPRDCFVFATLAEQFFSWHDSAHAAANFERSMIREQTALSEIAPAWIPSLQTLESLPAKQAAARELQRFCFAEALRNQSIAVAIYPRSASLRLKLANYVETNSPEEAFQLIKQTAAEIPCRESLVGLGRELERRGEQEEALRTYKQALEFAPHDKKVLHLLADCYDQLHLQAERLKVLQRLVEAHPESCDAHLRLYYAQKDNGNDEAALPLLLRAAHLFLEEGRRSNLEVMGIGLELFHFGRHDNAYELLRSYLIKRDGLQPAADNSVSWDVDTSDYNLGWSDEARVRQSFRQLFTGLMLNRWTRETGSPFHEQRPAAREVCEFLLQRFPDDPLNLVYLAMCVRDEDPGEAIRLCRQALERLPEQFEAGWAHLEIGDILVAQDRHEEARAEYRRVLEIPRPEGNKSTLFRYAQLLESASASLYQQKEFTDALEAQQACVAVLREVYPEGALCCRRVISS
jgi:tetratricopeptide (TPR) repeat protein